MSSHSAYAGDYEDCLYSYGLQNIPSWQNACWKHVVEGKGNIGALWIASPGNAGSPEIEIDTNDWQTVALYGLVAGHATGYQGGAANIEIQPSNFYDTFHNYPSLLYRWGIDDEDHPLNSSNMDLYVPNFRAHASESIDSDGIRYRASVPVYRCWSPDPSGDSCWADPIDVILLLRGFHAHFDSATSLSFTDPKTQEDKIVTANHDYETAIADNYILNPTKTEDDPYEYRVHFKHQITRTDGYTDHKAANNWTMGPSSGDGSPGFNGRDDVWYNPGDDNTKIVTPKDSQDDDSTVTGEVDVGKNKNICYGISHDKTVLMGNDGRYLRGWDWHTSRACVNVIHLANFQLEDDVKFNNDDVVYAGETANLTANFYNYKAPRDDINHTASPKDTRYRQIYFYTNDIQNKQLTGGVTNTDDEASLCAHFGVAGCQSGQIKGLEDNLADRHIGADTTKSTNISVDVDDIDVAQAANNKLCVAVAVNPSQSLKEPDKEGRSVENNWVISNATCRTITKKPNVNVESGDVFASGGITAATSLKNYDGGKILFGSWAEYLAISRTPNPITKFSSGGVLAQTEGDKTDCQYSPLSIASAAHCKNKTDSEIGNAIIHGNTQFLANMMGMYAKDEYKKGDTVAGFLPEVWYTEGDVTVSGDIINEWSGSSASVPQMIILARKINITSNVNRIDAWLVAYGDKNGDAYRGGTIDTCAGFNLGDGIGACDNQLEVNGPVMAREIFLNRSAGSSPGIGGSKTPAEIFNLTPAAYEWGYSEASGGGTAQAHTVYSREIAPRL